MMTQRRQFLAQTVAGFAAATCVGIPRLQAGPVTPKCRFGLVTYMWGKDLDVPALIDACEKSEVLGVELRTTHAHGVEPTLDAAARQAVRERFRMSRVELVGIGSNERFDYLEADEVRAAVDRAKAFVRLSNDIGGSGVKVKGDGFHDEVSHETTLTQVIGVLRELGDYASQYDQQIRLEVHGGFRDIEVHHDIISRVNHPNVRTCWNSNTDDLQGAGLQANFEMLRRYFGQTAHVRQLDAPDYPWDQLMKLFVASEYDGWVMLEAHGDGTPANVADRLQAQKALFDKYRDQAVANLSK